MVFPSPDPHKIACGAHGAGQCFNNGSIVPPTATGGSSYRLRVSITSITSILFLAAYSTSKYIGAAELAFFLFFEHILCCNIILAGPDEEQ